VLERHAYLNAGSTGPLPRRTVDAQIETLRNDLANGRGGAGWWEVARAMREDLRAALGRILNAPEGSIALTTSTTEGCNSVVNGLRLQPGDEIVTTDVEHPGLTGALNVCNATVRVARVGDRPAAEALEAIEAELTDRTKLIGLSHVAWTTGQVLPIGELTRHGIPVLVDGAQAAGAIPVDVQALGVDFYTVSAQKWLLGPDPTGALYVKPGREDDIAMTTPSYMAWENPAEHVPWPGARRFESVLIPGASIAGLTASITFAEEVGEERFAHARSMAERARELIGAKARVVTEPGQGTLVSFEPGNGSAADVVTRLGEAGVVVRSLLGPGWVRASCGFWTSDEDLERLAAAL
jgi:L-cysteine/cystine lyase